MAKGVGRDLPVSQPLLVNTITDRGVRPLRPDLR